MTRRPARRMLDVALAIGGATLVAALALNEIRFNTPSFDGSLNLQVPVSLATSGRYATTYPAVDALTLQSGPPFLLAIALSFRVFGVSSWSAQLPNACFLAAAVAFLMFWAGRLGGAWSAPTVLLLMLSTPRLLDIGLRGYGELPALFCFLAALAAFAAWDRERGRAPWAALWVGVWLSLAVLIKTVLLIGFAATALAVAAGLLLRQPGPSRREVAAFALGAVAVFGSFEAFKISSLGLPAYIEWWQRMLPAIQRQAGLTEPDLALAGPVPAFGARFATLAQELGLPVIALALFLVAPYVLLLVLIRSGPWHASSGRGPLLLLASTSGLYLAWWLGFTPLDRIWLRRVFNGILLHELLAAILIAVALAVVRAKREATGTGGLTRGAMAALGLSTLGAALTLAWVNLPDLELRRQPTAERVAVEALANRIRELPPEAVIYGRGWWQAPTVAFFSGRRFEDLDWVSEELLERDLDQHFLVVDRSFAKRASADLQNTLARLDYEVVESILDHRLLRIRRIDPYPPFPVDVKTSDLQRQVDVSQSTYPYLRGLHKPSPRARWASRFAGVLLRREAEQCLRLKLWFPDMRGYQDGTVRLAVEMDDRLLAREEITASGSWDKVLPLPDFAGEATPVHEVEIGIDDWWRPWVGNFAQLGFLMSEVGFVDCPSR